MKSELFHLVDAQLGAAIRSVRNAKGEIDNVAKELLEGDIALAGLGDVSPNLAEIEYRLLIVLAEHQSRFSSMRKESPDLR